MKTMSISMRVWCAAVIVLSLGSWALPGREPERQEPVQKGQAHAKPTRPDAANRLKIEVSGGDDNKPVENASVYVKYVESRLLKDKKVELNVKTNREGVAHIADAPMGRALIQVIAEGWKTYGRWYDVTEPQQTIKVHLERPPKWY